MAIIKYYSNSAKIIFSYISPRTIGDFTEQLLISAAIKENLNEYKLGLFYINDKKHKDIIISLYDGVDYLMKGDKGMNFPINYFDAYSGRPLTAPRMEEFGVHMSRLIFSGNSLTSMSLPSFDYVPRLRVPAHQKLEHENLLQTLGLDPERWFACFFWRELGYQGRPSHSQRDITDPAPYIDAIRFIVEDLGGQVVRLGHPTDTQMPDHPSIIDLSKIDDSLMTQIVAISRSRFFVSSCSGPITFGSGFGVPTAATNNIDISGVWNDHDIILTKKIISPGGKIYQQKSALDAGLLKPGQSRWLNKPENGYSYVNNSARELRHITDLLYHRTDNCPRWREEEFRTLPPGKEQISFPLVPAVKDHAFVDIPN